MAQAPEEHVWFTPKHGVKIYTGGAVAAHEGGKPIRIPKRVADGLRHVEHAPEPVKAVETIAATPAKDEKTKAAAKE